MLSAACLLTADPSTIFLESSIDMIEWVPRATFSTADQIVHWKESPAFTSCIERGVAEGKRFFFTRFRTGNDQPSEKMHLVQTPMHVLREASMEYVVLMHCDEIVGVQILIANGIIGTENDQLGASCVRIRRIDADRNEKSTIAAPPPDDVASAQKVADPREGKAMHYFYLVMVGLILQVSVRVIMG